MKTLMTAVILSVMFLSAGAIAGANRNAPGPEAESINITVMSKNQAWPLAGLISVEPCNRRRCIGI